jgi:GDP-D-mannose dehydratase
MKTALIIGVSGQDGTYLAKLLLEKGYDATKAYVTLGWKSSYTMPDVVRMMVQAELNEGKTERRSSRF